MNVYIWKSGYGGYHAIAVAESVDEAREKINNQLMLARNLKERMDSNEFISDKWIEMDDELNSMAGDPSAAFNADISCPPTYILACTKELSESVCLKLGNDA